MNSVIYYSTFSDFHNEIIFSVTIIFYHFY